MANFFKKSAMAILGAAVFVGGFALDGPVGSLSDATLIAPAYARVGRPLTPVSYAGVARRTTRRAVVATGAAAAAARPVVVAPAPTVVVAPTTQTCVDAVGPNGVITRTCR
jgi:hypothetical protein